MAENVAYAAAMSSGETASVPSPSEAYGWSGVRCTPSRCAICQTYAGPASSVSCAKIVLSDCSVARVTDSVPRYELSYVCTSHGLTGLHHGPTVHVNGADV